MNKQEYTIIENYMLKSMKDKNEVLHVYRVLNNALNLGVEGNRDIIIASALLHDIGKGGKGSHAQLGSKMAKEFLLENGFNKEFAKLVKDCIASHSLNTEQKAQSIEAQILFDGDKLDMMGIIGFSRWLMLLGKEGEALYDVDINELDVFGEYLVKLGNSLYTKEAKEIANKLIPQSQNLINSLKQAIRDNMSLNILSKI